MSGSLGWWRVSTKKFSQLGRGSFEELLECFPELSVVDGVDERVEEGVDVSEPGGQEESRHRGFEVRPAQLHGDARPGVANEERKPADQETNWNYIGEIFNYFSLFSSIYLVSDFKNEVYAWRPPTSHKALHRTFKVVQVSFCKGTRSNGTNF